MPKISDSMSYKNIVCPFCSIHCDDINIDVTDNKLSVKNSLVASCKEKFEQYNNKSLNQLSARVDNKSVDNAEAINECKKLIKNSRESIILNSSADVNTVREMLTATANISGIYDHINSDTFLKNIGIFQRKGYMATTLSEIKNKSDVILLFSDSILRKYPRLAQRVLLSNNSFSVNAKKKKIFVIGNKNNVNDCAIKDKRITYINFDNKNIPALLESLSIKSNKTKLSEKIFKDLMLNVSSSSYLSVLWATSELMKHDNCQNILDNLSDYVLEINKKTRAACLPLSGNNGDTSCTQTAGWLTGFPTRLKFTGSYFEYDRDSYNAKDLIKSNNIDLVIHINTISDSKLVLNKKHINIIIGQPSTKYNIEPDVFIPCGIPGIDYKGLIFRTDNVVTLPLSALRNPLYRSANEILREITNQ